MKQLLLNLSNGNIDIIETPSPLIKSNHVLVRTIYSAVSKGTEGSLLSFGDKNLIQKIKERPSDAKIVLEKMKTDGVLNTIETAFNRLQDPLPLGYSAVGEVIEIGQNVNHVIPGDYVAIAGKAYHAELNLVSKNLASKINKKTQNLKPFALGAIGSIAIHAIHQADARPGEKIGVIGIGLIGHLIAKILHAYSSEVIGLDLKEIEDTHKNSFNQFFTPNQPNLKEEVNNLTKGRGLDKVIIAASTSSNEPLDLAIDLIRKKGIITMVGVTKMNIDRKFFYEKELTFNIATSYGPGRYDSNYEEKGQDYPYEYVPNTQGRNLDEFVRLIESNQIDLTNLITDEIHHSKTEEISNYLHLKNRNSIACVLKYDSINISNHEKVVHKEYKPLNSDYINVGFIGVGRFVSNVIIPNMLKTKKYHILAAASTGGINIAKLSNKYKFDYTTNNYKDILHDNNIDLVVVATEHSSHAQFVKEALLANKHVYVEKPLAIKKKEIESIIEIFDKSKARLFVGFNRRHSKHMKDIKKRLKNSPRYYDYYVNAGKLNADDWTADKFASGGRLIGEAIHFIDVINFLENSYDFELSVDYNDTDKLSDSNNFIIRLKYSSGSMASINYISEGNSKYPKETLRIASQGKTIILNNYLHVYEGKEKNTSKIHLRQDKGFKSQYLNFFNILHNNKGDFQSIEELSKLHNKILELLDDSKN